MRWNALLILLLGSMACSSTGSSPIDPSTEPAGWIYFIPNESFIGPPSRIDVRTGAVQSVHIPPPFNPDRASSFFAGQVSPIDGKITGLASLGGPLPETFVYYPQGDSIEVIRDSWQGNFRVSLDARHTWSPDGTWIAIERHQVQFCNCTVLIVVNPVTGVTDTILPTPLADHSDQIFWFGSDTVVYLNYANWNDVKFTAISLATHSRSDWNLVPFNVFQVPIISRNRRWIAYVDQVDTTVVEGDQSVAFWRFRLLDRQSGRVTTVVADSVIHGTIPPSVTFDPDSRYVAYCSGRQIITIRGLGAVQRTREFNVPYCSALRWSWGPEGREADFAE